MMQDLTTKTDILFTCKKVSSWSLESRPADAGLTIDEVDLAIQHISRDLCPCNKEDLFKYVIKFCSECSAFGWSGTTNKDDMICIAKNYCKTLEFIPYEYIEKILDMAIQTWTHGQYTKMPSPAHLKSCVPEEYYIKKKLYLKLKTAKLFLKKTPKEISSKNKVNINLLQIKKIDAD